MASPPFAAIVAPIAHKEIDAALRWWATNRPGAPAHLAQELETVLRVIEHVPEMGRRTRGRRFRHVRRLLRRGSGYHLYYQVHAARREVRIVHFRHARRGPLPER